MKCKLDLSIISFLSQSFFFDFRGVLPLVLPVVANRETKGMPVRGRWWLWLWGNRILPVP